jgi:hypothetical protein
LPRSRSSSRIRWWASRSALTGTTSSLVATAAVALDLVAVPDQCGMVTQGLDLGEGHLIVKYARLDHLRRTGLNRDWSQRATNNTS